MEDFTQSIMKFGSNTLFVYDGDSYRGGAEQVFYNMAPPGMTYTEKYNAGQPDERNMTWPYYLKTYSEFDGLWFSSMISGHDMKVYFLVKLDLAQENALDDAYNTHQGPVPIIPVAE